MNRIEGNYAVLTEEAYKTLLGRTDEVLVSGQVDDYDPVSHVWYVQESGEIRL